MKFKYAKYVGNMYKTKTPVMWYGRAVAGGKLIDITRFDDGSTGYYIEHYDTNGDYINTACYSLNCLKMTFNVFK